MKKTQNSLRNFIPEHLGELHNVTWPTQKQAVHAMILVLVIMLLVGSSLSVIDYLLNQAILLILK